MKAYEVAQKLEFLTGLAGKVLPARLGFAISVNIEQLSGCQRHIDKERVKLLEGYAARDENGEIIMEKNDAGQDTYKLEGENLMRFREEFGEFLETDISLDLRSVDESVLEQIDKDPRYTGLTVAEMASLRFMISE